MWRPTQQLSQAVIVLLIVIFIINDIFTVISDNICTLAIYSFVTGVTVYSIKQPFYFFSMLAASLALWSSLYYLTV